MSKCRGNYWHAFRDLTGLVGKYGWTVQEHAYVPSWKQAAPKRRDRPPHHHTCDEKLSIRQKLSENNEVWINMESLWTWQNLIDMVLKR